MYQVLTERAIIVDLDVHSWAGQKLDKDVSKDVATRAGSLSDPDEVGRYTKYLVAREALAPIKKLGGEIRAAHLKFTMPWIGDSRVLPVALYDRYVRVVDDLIRKRDAAREEFIDAYPRHMREARERRLVKLFDPSEYPSISKLRELITAEYGFTPMPSVDHLAVVGLTRTVSVRIRKSIERQIERRVAATVRDLDKKTRKTDSEVLRTAHAGARRQRENVPRYSRDKPAGVGGACHRPQYHRRRLPASSSNALHRLA